MHITYPAELTVASLVVICTSTPPSRIPLALHSIPQMIYMYPILL